MKRTYGSIFLSSFAILALMASPAKAAQDDLVVASAVVVPAQTWRMSFLSSALVMDVAVEEGDRVSAGQSLVTLNSPDLEYYAIAAQEAFRSAQAYAELQRYKRVKDRRNGKVFWDVVPPEVRQRADARAASAQAAMEAAQAALEQSILLAPQDATVASVNVLPGEFVQQNQTVLTLAALDQLQIETTDLSERDITKVKVGAPASIYIESLNESFPGEVKYVSPIASTVGGDVVFTVTLAFDEQPKGLLWGMTAEVTIGDQG
jgi:RND family efflux transporter MFP subunit